MNILITGGSGFVGSSLACAIKADNPEYKVYTLDNLRRRGSELNLSRLNNLGISFIHGDVRNKEDLFSIGVIFDIIIDASADCSVSSGMNNDSEYVVNTNLMGTFNCLELAKKNKSKFIFLSTSRVYGIKSLESIQFEETETRYKILDTQIVPEVSIKGITEKFSTEGIKSLYGATKLASEQLVQEYGQMFGFECVINRCGIITGPWQMGHSDQGIITMWLARHHWKRSLKYTGYFGKGKQVRDVIDVDDICRLIIWQLHNFEKVNGQIFNVGGGINNSVSLLELTKLCKEVTENTVDVDQDLTPRRNDIRVYVTDNTKIQTLSGWYPEISTKETLMRIHNWIRENEHTLFTILN
jgi:CDP-paratose 2-epimerase